MVVVLAQEAQRQHSHRVVAPGAIEAREERAGTLERREKNAFKCRALALACCEEFRGGNNGVSVVLIKIDTPSVEKQRSSFERQTVEEEIPKVSD